MRGGESNLTHLPLLTGCQGRRNLSSASNIRGNCEWEEIAAIVSALLKSFGRETEKRDCRKWVTKRAWRGNFSMRVTFRKITFKQNVLKKKLTAHREKSLSLVKYFTWTVKIIWEVGLYKEINWGFVLNYFQTNIKVDQLRVCLKLNSKQMLNI